MISTICAQPYFIAPITRKNILKIASQRLQRMQSNHPTNLVFIQEIISRKHTGRAPSYLRPLLKTWRCYHTILNCLQDTCSHYIYLKKRKKGDIYIYIYIYIVCILSCCHLHISGLSALCKFFSLIDCSSEHCLKARSLRLLHFLHTSKPRSLYKFLSLIDNTPEHRHIRRSSRLVCTFNSIFPVISWYLL